MMWIVRLALQKKYTFIVMATLMLILGAVTIETTPTDIFPSIDIPVVAMIWSYSGISATDMAERIVSISERSATTSVSNLEHIESQSMPGVSITKFYFQNGSSADAGLAQLTANAQTVLQQLPVGQTPPYIIQYNASDVPILQLVLSSTSLSQTQLLDYATNFVRTPLSTIKGAVISAPYGGRARVIAVDLNNRALRDRGLTPADVSSALSQQNIILPTGTIKIDKTEYNVILNNSPLVATDLGNIPIKQVNGATVYVRDVAQVRDGYSPQQNVVDTNGGKSVLISVLKSNDASTLDVVQRIKEALPGIEANLPKSLKITALFDQSLFVRAAISGVVREASIAACLTALMILIFLGSWKSTLIVATSIPLAILTSLTLLGFLGQTINEMTLGGLALAVGILVDDATVEIENIHRNMVLETRGLKQVILDGAAQIAAPTFIATVSICIVFVSVIFLTGPAKFLFTPLALAVVFAMLASYLLSRTLVPVMASLMLNDEIALFQQDEKTSHGGFIWAIHKRFDSLFEWVRDRYSAALRSMLRNRRATILGFAAFFLFSLCLFPLLGQDFFPKVDEGMLQLHVRAPKGTRLEETTNYFFEVEEEIKRILPKGDIQALIDDIGLPPGGLNLTTSDTSTVGVSDGQIFIDLKNRQHPTAYYEDLIRTKLTKDFPFETFFFQPADMESQILDAGLPAPLDIQVVGGDPRNYNVAQNIAAEVKKLPGAADVYIQQIVSSPSMMVNINRTRAMQLGGLTQRAVANSIVTSLSGSTQTSPGFWLDPSNGVSYSVSVETPQYRMNSPEAIREIPVNASGTPTEPLSNLATLGPTDSAEVVNHYNILQTYDVYANVDNRDLQGLTADVENVLAKMKSKLPRGTTTVVRGQAQSMKQSFSGLRSGIIFAIILVYLLMVVNFQSLIDPLIVVAGLPGAMSGILWMLFLTSTHLSVPALMGTIMSIGVATANSILVITFANDRRLEGDDSIEAAYQAGLIRFRPVLMTSIAMVIGMLPMALALGEGGEENAPLGRAVLGGLVIATATTLFFVPVVYSLLRRKQPEPED